MANLFDNEITQGVLLTIIGVLILGIFGWLKFKRDEKIVKKYLKDLAAKNKHSNSTTHAISSATNLSKERIRKICSKSSDICKHPKEKGSWKLFE